MFDFIKRLFGESSTPSGLGLPRGVQHPASVQPSPYHASNERTSKAGGLTGRAAVNRYFDLSNTIVSAKSRGDFRAAVRAARQTYPLMAAVVRQMKSEFGGFDIATSHAVHTAGTLMAVIGDREGISFVPPQDAQQIVDAADTTPIHDEWTRKKFDEGKYKSTDIYSRPTDPALLKEYSEYLAKRLAEIRAQQPK